MNIEQLLYRLNQNDESAALSDEDFNELIGDIKNKLDNIKDFISRCEAESNRLKTVYIDPIQKRKKAIDNSVSNLRDWLTNSMQKSGFEYLEGDLFKVKLYERKSIELSNVEITSNMFLKYKDVLKRQYVIDKKLLGEKLKEDAEKYAVFGRETKTIFPKFGIKSGEKRK